MIFLISLILALCIAWFGKDLIKKYAKACYIVCILISLLVIAVEYNGNVKFPAFVENWIWPMFSNCSLSTALFVVVMMTGALPNGSKGIKRLMPIRAELSIMASILTLGHNIAYGKRYFVWLFTAPERLSGALLYAAICSILMLLIMLPLMITSFPSIRKKMKAKKWKKLQRMAYLFYALIYVHVMLLDITFLYNGQNAYMFNIIVFSVIFLTYAAMRIRKALLKKSPRAANVVPWVCAVLGIIFLVIVYLPTTKTEKSSDIETETKAAAETVEYKDGNYFGTGTGYNGEIKVAVTISEGSIKSVIIVSTKDDSSYWSKAASLTETIIAKQSAEVDTVSGATYSSKGLIEAVKNALESAEIQ